eukprot:GHVR01000514.1.p1 GENE.GHVR01000514.1~~GHVR01000514.1.p1  ORF type:complete len:119 (+),score=16.87 GHVR01000514.1:46-402(+)
MKLLIISVSAFIQSNARSCAYGFGDQIAYGCSSIHDVIYDASRERIDNLGIGYGPGGYGINIWDITLKAYGGDSFPPISPTPYAYGYNGSGKSITDISMKAYGGDTFPPISPTHCFYL